MRGEKNAGLLRHRDIEAHDGHAGGVPDLPGRPHRPDLQRYDIIRLYLKPEIAGKLDVSLTQVYLILNLYKKSGIEGLELKYPPGRSRKMTAEQEKELCRIMTGKLPKEVGLEPYCNWTAPLACKYVKEHYGVTSGE